MQRPEPLGAAPRERVLDASASRAAGSRPRPCSRAGSPASAGASSIPSGAAPASSRDSVVASCPVLSVDVVVCGNRQELRELVAQRHLLEQRARPRRRAAGPRALRISSSMTRRTSAVGEASRGAATARPATGRSRRLRRPPSGCRSPRADTVEPRRDVLDADADVEAQARLGDGARRRTTSSKCRRVRFDALAQLVRAGCPGRVEALARDRDEIRVGHPRTVESVARPHALCPRGPSPGRPRSPRVPAIGMKAAMPPMACAPRRWQVWTSSSA